MSAGQVKTPLIIPLKAPQSSKTKNLTTDIKIDLVSDSADNDIYFTLNGSKPEPFRIGNESHTFKFTVPFCLPAGKRIIKAISVSKTGNRESNIVTKVFDIEQTENQDTSLRKPVSDVYGFLEELKEHKKTFVEGYSQESKIRAPEKVRLADSSSSSGILNPNIKSLVPQYLTTRASGNQKYNQTPNSHSNLKSEDNTDIDTMLEINHEKKKESDYKQSLKLINDFSNHSLRIQRETDFLKCIYCLALRPTDPLSKFCNNCGQAIAPLPQLHLPPPENGQLGICINCKSMVPMNLLNCLVCEAPLDIQNQPQVTNKLSDRICCEICGTANPQNMESCLTCEAKLPEDRIKVRNFQSNFSTVHDTTSTISQWDMKTMNCCKCGKRKNLDARYCDWCGNKHSIGQNFGHVICQKCGANNQNNAIYCGQCGNTLTSPHNQVQDVLNGNKSSISLPLVSSNGIIKPENFTSPNYSNYIQKKSVCDISTQTVGLFYPSTAQLKKNEEKDRHLVSNGTWDKLIPLTLISPGKGYWRKQIDHVIGHLKAHVSHSPEFQAMIGEPRMGKLISADVHEEDMEVTVSLTFSLKGYKDPYKNENSDEFDNRYLSSILKRTGSFDSFRSDETLQSNETRKPKKTPTTSSRCRFAKRKTLNKKNSNSLTEIVKCDIDGDLIKEIGKSGEDRMTELERLFNEGANPRGKNKKGVPFLIMAIRNKHRNAIHMLLKSGANINDTEPEYGNSPLHEAVILGSLYIDITNMLLNYGANIKIKNHNGETPTDLALKLNNTVAMKKLSTKIGKYHMDKLIQPMQPDNDDNENI